jgi:hypothetical protein
MSRGGVYGNVDELASSAGKANGLSAKLYSTGLATSAVSLDGIEPSVVGRTRSALHRANALATSASHTAEQQVTAMQKKASLLRTADAGRTKGGPSIGAILSGLGKALVATSGWDLTSYLNDAREKSRAAIERRMSKDLKARKKLKYAEKIWNDPKESWRRKKWASPEAMRRDLRRKSPSAIRNLERKTRLLNPSKVLSPGVRNNPIVKGIAKKAPLIGPALSFSGNLAGGASPADAAGKTAVTTAGGMAGGAAGAAACGAVAASTFGIGAATCPALTIGGSILGDKVAGVAYDGAKKLLGLDKPEPKPMKLQPVLPKIKIPHLDVPTKRGHHSEPAL